MKDFFQTVPYVILFLNVLYLLYSLLSLRKKGRYEREALERMCDHCIHIPMDCESCIQAEDLRKEGEL